ncbi:NAD(P)H-dependent oxidoreductase [Nonomuraea longicatena]|uniref:NAD(P)H-dependent oxidoreductase n=1 Tax=Nonomuraea longicatena TaxID=83682 RepID=A0ABN1P1B8_9ACTN
MSIVTVVGNPRRGSRTYGVALAATLAVAERLGREDPPEVVDLSVLAPVLLDPAGSPDLSAALEAVSRASVVVFASPTYKATYTGLLKSFADRLPSGALAGVAALPVLVMGDARHALAVETHFRPLLVELGARVPTPGLAVVEADLPADAALSGWADQIAPQVAAQLAAHERALGHSR